MRDIINILEILKSETILDLKNGKSELLQKKLDLDRAIKSLEFCEEYSLFINKKDKYSVIKLPYPLSTGLYSDYRVIDDCETDDKRFWKELKIDNESLILSPDDIIIKKE